MDPAAPALVARDRCVSYAALFAQADETAAWLRSRPGWGRDGVPRVGLTGAGGIDYVAHALGLLLAGACLVPVAPELTTEEQRELAARTALHGVLAPAGSRWLGVTEADLRWIPLDGGGAPGFPAAEFNALDPAFIRFSSGTTGDSKGVVLGHDSLHARLTAANRALGIGPHDRVLWMLPMAHHFAVSIMLYLHHGACTVIEESPAAADILAVAERERATVVYGAPFHISMLAADTGPAVWPTLRLAVSTAAALGGDAAGAFRRRFGRPVVQGLGIIEAGLPLLNRSDAGTCPTALGRPLPDFRAEVRGPDGSPLPRGACGELWISGPGMFDAYLSPWKPRADVCHDGWFATGDLVEQDADGLFHLRGRVKSVLNVGGMKVFPEEVEQILDRHPGVLRSRVTGIDHPWLGTLPQAEVVPGGGCDPADLVRALLARCRSVLSPHKVPARILVVSDIPLTASGKVKR